MCVSVVYRSDKIVTYAHNKVFEVFYKSEKVQKHLEENQIDKHDVQYEVRNEVPQIVEEQQEDTLADHRLEYFVFEVHEPLHIISII